MPTIADNEIIEGCKSGNRVCQEKLYYSYYSFLMKIAVRYVSERQDAEQLVHDCFMKIYTNITGFKQEASFSTWASRIMVNTCLDFLKSKMAASRKELVPLEEGDMSELFTAPYESALDKLSFKELLEQIHNLNTLTRTVFNMYVLDGFSHKEIATILGIAEGTSYWHLNQARKQLQSVLKKENSPKHE